MEQKGDKIIIGGLDEAFDSTMQTNSPSGALTYHFSQGEDFFVQLPQEIEIPAFPIHHDIRNKHPTDQERASISTALYRLAPHISPFITGTRFFFDPTENQKPSFIQFLKCEDQIYAYIFRIDLAFKASHARMLSRGSNDTSCVYASRNFFIEADLIPLNTFISLDKSSLELRIIQNISETWIGESGRGYFVQGIWLDREITKFFTRLILPKGKRLYPYFPLNCKYRSICYQSVDLSPDGRKRSLLMLHNARKILTPHIEIIEKNLHHQDFSEDLDSFIQLKSMVSPKMEDFFKNYTMRAYLNTEEMKEYEITY